MRSDNSAFSTVNKARNRELFFVVEIAFDLANTDLLYLTFDTTPGLSGANVINGCLESISGSTQKINPDKALSTIGAMTFSAIDIGLTDYQKAKLTSGNGLRGKRARFYVGGAGLDWTAFVLAQTQIIDSVDFKDGVYTFKCADIQRQMRVDIFDMKKTALSGHLGKSDLTIPVYSTDGFYRVKHPVSLDGRPDAHGQKVGYIKITQGDDVEIIRYTGTNTGEFTGCTRGVLGTRAIEIALPVDDEDVITTNANNAPKVEEYVYLELPAPMLAYALLTGSIYGEPGEYLPPHWHLGISTDFVKTSDFTGIGTDWWDPTNADLGVVAVIKGQTKTDGKKFIEEQIYRMLGAFSPVYSTGELGLKRLTVVISAGGHDRALDSSNIIDYGELTHDMKSVINKIAITWNWVETRKAYTRTNILLDTDSIARHGESDPLELTLRCLETSRHSYTTLKSRFDSLRDRYAGPPLRLNLKLTPDQNDVEVGDIVRVNLAAIRDYSGDTIDGSLVRNFEIQQVSTDWVTGDVSVSLFGSSERAGAFAGDEVGTPIDSSFYYSEGTEINATNFPGKVSSAGGITTVLTNFTLAGSTDLNSAASIFYVNENLSVPDGKVIFGTGNVQLRVAGEALINGGIDLRGGGNAGGTPGADVANGWIGRSYSQPGLRYNTTPGNLNTGGSGFARGLHTATPEIALEIVNDAIVGLPSDITGQPGQSGGESYKYISNTSTKVSSATGGNGGAGGGGIAIIATGIDFGANGYIDTSGADGTAGSSFVDGSRTIYGGRGAGGAPGSIYFILTDENGARPQIDNSRQRCYYGSADASGYSALIDPDLFKTRHPKISDAPTGAISGFESETEWYATVLPSRPSPDHTTNLYYAWTKLAFLAGYVPAVEDVPKNSADVVSFTLTEYTNTPPSQKADLSTIEVSVTGPSDPNYSYAFIQYKIGLNDPWLDAGPASPEAVFVVPSDGATYYARALAVSKSGARSPTGPIDSITVANVINDPDTAAPTVLTFDAITVYSESGGATFTGKDAKFSWNDSNSLKSYFLNYQIEILDGSSNLMRTETTTDPFYVYTYEKNKEDYQSYHSAEGANRSFSIRVTVLGRVEVTGGQYNGPSYTLPVSNPAPAAVGSLVISAGYGVVYVGGTNPTDLDFTQFAIHVSATPGFTASPSTLVGYATRLPITIAADAAGNKLSDGGQYYIRIQSFDEFGAGGITTDYSALMLGIPVGTEIPVSEVLTVDGRIIADASGDPYRVTLGPHVTSSRASLFSFKNTTTGTPYFTLFEDGEVAISGKITIAAGSTGIGSFSDAGALATADEIAYDEITGTKPPFDATKNTIYYEETAPYGQEGDLWKKPGGAFYRHDGSADGDISTLVYDSVLLGVSSYEQTPTSVYVSPDGHHLFMCGNVSDKVHQFSLSIANSLTGASYVGFFSVAAEDILPQGMTFAPDGTKMFMCGQSTDKLYQYNLTTPWTITSGVTIAGSVTVAAASNGVSVIDSRVYISTFSAIHQYTCVAGDYDITSGVTSVGSFSTASHGNNHDVVVLPVGDTMYTADPTNDVIHQWALTDFDVTSAVHVSSFSVAAQSTFITGLCFSGDRGKLFIADYNAASTDAIYQYSLASPWVQVATENNHYSQAVAPTGIKGDTWYNTDSREFYNHDGTTWVVSATVGATWGTDVTGQPEDSNILNSLQSWFQIADKPTTLAAFDEDAATTLDDKTIAYFQASQPTGTQNDLWFDTDDGNKLYRHNGTSWQVAQDSKIGQALFNAQTAQDTADGKAVIYYATSAPGAATSGDLWKDTDGTKHLYRKNAGGGWDVVSTENKIFHQEATPTGSLGDMWFKPSTNEFKQHNGSTWAYVSDVTGAKTALNTANVGSSTAATVESGANKANAGLNSAGEIQKVIKGTNIPTPTSGLAVGLNLTGNYLGYNSTGTSSGWKTYMTNTGNFYLAGAGTNSLSWNGTSLDIVGTITGSTINGGTINGTSIHGGNIYSGNFYTSSGSGGNPKIAIKSSNTTFVITDSSGVARVSMGSIGTLIDANGNNTPAIQGRCTSSNGILGISNSGDAIRGESASGHGVFGDTNGSSKAGVYGVGYGAARGVWGSSSYVGVWGETYANVVGVAGFANAASGGSGVQGEGTTQGGFFYSNKANGKGVVAHGNSTNGMGIDAYGALYGGYFSTGGSIAIQCNGAIRLGSGTVHSFTGTHDCLVIDGDTLPVQGDIVEVVTVVNRASVDDIIPQVILAATAQSKKAYGVCSRIGTFPAWHAPTASNIVSQPSEEGADPILESTSSATSQNIDIGGLSNMSQTEYEAIVANYTLVSANGVGEGQINVCSANGDFEVGDFICTSTVAGKGQRYDGNDMRVVVAKCLEPVVWANETETTKMVACVYMCS